MRLHTSVFALKNRKNFYIEIFPKVNVQKYGDNSRLFFGFLSVFFRFLSKIASPCETSDETERIRKNPKETERKPKENRKNLER